MKKILSLFIVISIAVSLFACSSGELKEDGDRLIDSENNISWRLCSISLQAKKILSPVTKYGNIELYEVSGLPKNEYLSENYDGIGGLYCAEDIKEPDLEGFGAVGADVCYTTGSVVKCSEITDKAVIDKIIELFKSGENTIQPINVASSWQIKLYSEAYPALYYNISAIRSSSGKLCLYDKGTKKCVEASSFLDEYLI